MICTDCLEVLFGAGDTLAQQAVEKKGFKNHDLIRTGRMAAYGGCEWHQKHSNTTNADVNSCLRSCCHQVVRDLAEEDQLPEQDPDYCGQGTGRSASICQHKHGCLLVDNVNLRGRQSTGEAQEELPSRTQGQLDDLACGTSRKLQRRPFGAPSAGRECCQLGLELLLELSEFAVSVHCVDR
jgi:hypothetical protein